MTGGSPHTTDPDLTIHVGDALDVLRTLPDRSVDMVATSPPFFGLRDYGTSQWEGGDADCDHAPVSGIQGQSEASLRRDRTFTGPKPQGPECSRCGARRIDRQIGLEDSPEAWAARLVQVFAECRRVLADHGSMWIECGDSYASSPPGIKDASRYAKSTIGAPPGMRGGVLAQATADKKDTSRIPGLKPKDLIGQPFLLAFALRDAGWYWRSMNVWAKPNAMPESVTDRPTVAHSYVLQLAKGQWKTRVVQLSDLDGKIVHLGDDFSSQDPNVWANELSICLASAILDGTEGHEKFALPPLDPEIGVERDGASRGDPVRSVPVEHRPAMYASRFLASHISAKEFLCELDGLGITLPDSHHFEVVGCPSPFALPSAVYAYGETSVCIKHPGEIREFDFRSHALKFSRPVRCAYWFDADAEREQALHPRFDGFRGGGAYIEQGRGTSNSEPSGESRSIRKVKGAESEPAGRNVRSVWTIPTQGYPGAHFATFPEKLVGRMIRLGCPEWVCRVCGTPRTRIVERELVSTRGNVGSNTRTDPMDSGSQHPWSGGVYGHYDTTTVGWSDCGHGYWGCGDCGTVLDIGEVSPLRLEGDPDDCCPSCGGHQVRRADHERFRPGVVLDPFGGAGTTGLAARKHGRHSILIELNPAYADLAADRLSQLSLLAGGEAA